MSNRDKGTILITTLWILTLLTLLALGIGMRVGIDIKMVSFFANSAKAHYIAEAGIRKTIFLLEADSNKNADSLNEIWSSGYDYNKEQFVLKDIKIGEGAFTVVYVSGKDEAGAPAYLYGASDEEGKLNINEIDGTILAGLPGFSVELASAVVDWRDEDDMPNPSGAETEYYEGLDNPYESKDAKFSVPEELMLVKGMTPEIYEGIKNVITVYAEGKAVNINTAPKEVLGVLVGQEFEDLPAKIVNYRNGSDGIAGTQDDNIFTDINSITAQLSSALTLNSVELNRILELKNAGYFKVLSAYFRIRSSGQVKNGKVKKTIEAVVKRTSKGSEFLYYYEI
ncbi:MAG: type II secretion system protein GspK [Candidatus Omnitrophica bacterium]|nr:type II secretion system protein GspK [Candidatus Omnitrophota bacterium]